MKKDDVAYRLRAARERAGFRSASDAARGMGINPVTYTAHENGGREYDRKAAQLYAQAFKVDPAWLLFGDDRGAPPAPAHESSPDSTPPPAGGDLHHPRAFTADFLRIHPDRSRVFVVRGDSMADPANPNEVGGINPGEQVVIDLDDRVPSPPGSFVVHDGAGLCVKQIEVVPGSSPLLLRVGGRNPRYSTVEVEADRVQIIGRVRAKVIPL